MNVETPVLIYKKFVSPVLHAWVGQSFGCKYAPTCSQYAADALRHEHFIRALALVSWRLLRCNPFSGGGYDPVRKV